jgi:hypothetical protein
MKNILKSINKHIKLTMNTKFTNKKKKMDQILLILIKLNNKNQINK